MPTQSAPCTANLQGLRPPPPKPSPEAWPQAERRANVSWRQDSGAKPVTLRWSQQPKDAPPPRTVLRTSVHGFSTFNVHISPLGGASKMEPPSQGAWEGAWVSAFLRRSQEEWVLLAHRALPRGYLPSTNEHLP